MILITTLEQIISEIGSRDRSDGSLGLVPTMGALHEAHLSLVKRAVAENDRIVVSIFVNPIQFNNLNDLKQYPRNLELDLRILKGVLGGNDVVFAPSIEEMYPVSQTKVFDFGSIDKVMEGRYREGHFNGVGIVVDKLFRLIAPDRAYFGEKDFQQLRVIQKLIDIEGHPVEVVPCAIIREQDGLALSSRNLKLSPQYRVKAPIIHAALLQAQHSGRNRLPQEVKETVLTMISEAGLEPEYVEIADEQTLKPVSHWEESDTVRCFVAAFAGEVRLIDNMSI